MATCTYRAGNINILLISSQGNLFVYKMCPRSHRLIFFDNLAAYR